MSFNLSCFRLLITNPSLSGPSGTASALLFNRITNWRRHRFTIPIISQIRVVPSFQQLLFPLRRTVLIRGSIFTAFSTPNSPRSRKQPEEEKKNEDEIDAYRTSALPALQGGKADTHDSAKVRMYSLFAPVPFQGGRQDAFPSASVHPVQFDHGPTLARIYPS